MRRVLTLLVLALTINLTAPVGAVFASEVDPVDQDTLETLSQLPLVISKIRTDGSGSQELVEIYNPNPSSVNLSGYQLQFLTEKFDINKEPTRLLKEFTSEVIGGYGFYVVGHADYAGDVELDAVFDVSAKGGSLAKNGSIRLVYRSKSESLAENGLIRLVDTPRTIDLVGWGGASQFETVATKDDGVGVLQRCQNSLSQVVDTDNNFNDLKIYLANEFRQFVACPEDDNPVDGGEDVEEVGLDIISPDAPESLNTCSTLRINEIGANLASEEQFIEVQNIGDSILDIMGCRLTTNRNDKVYPFGAEELQPREMFVVKIVDTGLTLTKTTTGTVYLLSEEGVEIDEVKYANLPKESSWSLLDAKWLVSYHLTPGQANEYLQYPPCETGYERNASTGRCNKIVDLASVLQADCGEGRERNPLTGRCRNIPVEKELVPCKEGQYRNEETGRCRSIALAVSSLKPCADDQFRNPQTNRCKKIASADDVMLADCGEGRERNPETNRCRNVLAVSTTKLPFAPENVTQVASATWGWWVFGGVSLLALGYAGWQWRWEVGRIARQVRSTFSPKNK